MRAAAAVHLGSGRVIVPDVLVVHSGHAHFQFHRKPVVLGTEALFVLGRPPLRKEATVIIELRFEGKQRRFRGVVDESLGGIGTLFRFTPVNGTADAIVEWLERTIGLISD